MRLSAVDVKRFTGIPGAAFMVEPDMSCELEPFHTGPHAAVVQGSDIPGRYWWAIWRASTPYRIALLPNCVVTHDDAVDEDGDPITCTAYGAHPGGHRWAL
ncbi:hypothetical protein ACFT0G_06225 [Streptomyces sp. NPDC057020]|uniref:hypothetical protein n=1 Tax=unclassified Streptomyces TaxID=2593676 RepID=UPI003637DC10